MERKVSVEKEFCLFDRVLYTTENERESEEVVGTGRQFSDTVGSNNLKGLNVCVSVCTVRRK